MNAKNILTVFAGREKNLRVLHKYLKKALELNIIQEVHFWNYTRKESDEKYLKNISNLKRSSSFHEGNYISITPLIDNNSFELFIKASNDIHIKIMSKNHKNLEYEIVLGCWYNQKSFIRENGKDIFFLNKNFVADINNKNKFKISIENNILHIYKEDILLFSQKINDNFEIKEIYFKTGYDAIGEIDYVQTFNHGFYFMDTCEKNNWRNYYEYYTNKEYENDIILKCDDDIIFIDLQKLPEFIDFVEKNDYDLVLANTINNGVAAYFQQNKYNLIPKELMELEYPVDGFCGSLWESGEKAEKLHLYFLENYQKILNYPYNKEIIAINTRFSINFFGYKGCNWYKIKDCSTNSNDEKTLTVDYVSERGFKNILYTDFYVSHLSFYNQENEGLNSDKIIQLYDKLCDNFISSLN